MTDEGVVQRRSAISLLAVFAMSLAGCESPWDRAPATAEDRDRTTHEIFANSASFGTWIDKRPKGQITHGKLIIDGPKPRASYFPPGSTVVVTTMSDIVAAKAEELSAGTLRIPVGMVTNYAIGRTVSVKIERILPGGERELVDEQRVSFLELIKR